jgi:hypothetical protein
MFPEKSNYPNGLLFKVEQALYDDLHKLAATKLILWSCEEKYGQQSRFVDQVSMIRKSVFVLSAVIAKCNPQVINRIPFELLQIINIFAPSSVSETWL